MIGKSFLISFYAIQNYRYVSHSGSISHESALDRAHKQYNVFIERRGLKAESQAENRYMNDLRKSVHTLEQKKKRKPVSKKNQKTSRIIYLISQVFYNKLKS